MLCPKTTHPYIYIDPEQLTEVMKNSALLYPFCCLQYNEQCMIEIHKALIKKVLFPSLNYLE